MARVTVEDCVLKIPNRFELVMLASQRAREISAGGAITIDRDNDKNPVIALREIADTDISIENLKEVLIKNYQKVIEIEEDDEEIIDVMEGEEDWDTASNTAVESEVANAGMHQEHLDESSLPKESEAMMPVNEDRTVSDTASYLEKLVNATKSMSTMEETIAEVNTEVVAETNTEAVEETNTEVVVDTSSNNNISDDDTDNLG